MDDKILKGRYPVLYGFLLEVDHDIPAAEIWDQLKRWSQQYLQCGNDRTREFQRIVDEVIEHQSKLDAEQGYPPVYCHKGCSNCCYQCVACTDEEAALLHNYCGKHDIAVDYGKLKRQLTHMCFDTEGNFTGETTWDDQSDADRSCVFLNEADGSCRVWEVRPLVCRVHLAEQTDLYCKTYNGTIDSRAKGLHYPVCSYILSAVFSIHHDSIGKMMNTLLLKLA